MIKKICFFSLSFLSYQGLDCTINDFEWYTDYHYGNCYRFNGNKDNIKLARQPGLKNGLRAEFFIGNLDNDQQFLYKSGMRVIIHNQSVIPFSDEDGLEVSAGEQTNIAITRLFVIRLPYPFSDCIDNFTSEENQSKNKFFKTLSETYKEMSSYNQKYCLKSCLQEYLIKECSCYDFKLPKPYNSNYKGCLKEDQIDCLHKKLIDYFDLKEVDNCYTNCPDECEEVIYGSKVTKAEYPSKWYSNVLNKSEVINQTIGPEYLADYRLLQQSTLMINVFYDEIHYDIIQDVQAYTIDYLIACIGGYYGLFLGTSFLTVVDFVELIFRILHVFTKRTSCYKKVKKVSSCNKKQI